MSAREAGADGARHRDERTSTANRIIKYAEQSGAELFADRRGQPWVAIPLASGGARTASLMSGDGERWVANLMWDNEHRTPDRNGRLDALEQLRGFAMHRSVHELFVRVAPTHPGGVAIDLGDPEWTAVIIEAGSWRLGSHPVMFRRPGNFGRLPKPADVGALFGLDSILNLTSERQIRQVVGFMIGALHPRGPYTILGLTGEQGSGKSVTARLVREILDPVLEGNGLTAMPRSEDAFWAGAANAWCPAFDNVSGMSPEQSDRLAQLATGAGRQDRKKYTDGEVYEQSATRPSIINGIELAERPDVLSRSIVLELRRLESYTTEEALLERFRQQLPMILRALYDAIADGLGRLPGLRQDGWGARMADHVRWVSACEIALGWEAGSYLNVFVDEQDHLMAQAAEGVVWLAALVQLITRGPFAGTAGELLGKLEEEAGVSVGGSSQFGWPRSGQGMVHALRRHASSIRARGLVVDSVEDAHSKQAIYQVRWAPAAAAPTDLDDDLPF